MKTGLDQATAMPKDSYMVDYFQKQRDFLDVGPPVYFVTKDINYTDKAVQNDLFALQELVRKL